MAATATVLIATYNRAPLLDQCLSQLRTQAFLSGDEVIVVDNGSSDNTAAVVARHQANGFGAPLRLLYETEPGKSRAIARGVTVATGDLLVFTDDDVNVDEGWLDAIRAPLRDPAVALAGGPVLPRFDPAVPLWIRRACEQHPRLGAPLGLLDYGSESVDLGPRTILGANMAVRRTVFDQIGGFPADLGKLRGTLLSGEDHAVCMRVQAAGFRAIYCPRAVVRHWVPRQRATVSYFVDWFFWSGITNAILEADVVTAGPAIHGMPLYLLKRAALASSTATAALIVGRRTSALNTAVDVAFVAGYAAERWRLRSMGQSAQAAGEPV